jgi:hypothetical protein
MAQKEKAETHGSQLRASGARARLIQLQAVADPHADAALAHFDDQFGVVAL